MIYALLILVCTLLAAWAGLATFYAYRWAQIILLLEDDLSEAVEVHERSLIVFERILNMPLFFDSPEVKPILQEALGDVKMCKLATQKLVTNFTARSKQRYVRVTEEKAVEGE